MIINGDCLEELNKLDENSVDAIVTDPPYGLTSITKRFGKVGSAPAKYGKDGSFARLSKGFMGKEWDGSGIEYNVELWQKCLRVLKPGGYLLAFGGTRTYHRIACAIEDAGFEIRDCILWLYGSGFPKSMNIGLAVDKKLGNESKVTGVRKQSGAKFKLKQELIDNGGFNDPDRKEFEVKEVQNEWKGWGTALKPSYEPIIVARKPFKGRLVDNVMKYGVGGININECRVPAENIEEIYRKPSVTKQQPAIRFNACKVQGSLTDDYLKGRFPANVLLDTREGEEWRRYFYCAKASKKDRDEGLEEFEKDITDDGRNKPIDNPYLRGKTMRHNTHPTVKPTALMQYLIRLVAPKGATILDPFMGSGSTGKAVMYENKERDTDYKFIGIEKDAEYCKIAEARIKHVGGEE